MEKRAYPLERLTSLGVGGPAERILWPETEAELAAALRRAAEEGVPVRALGGGKNLLVGDAGVAGLVVALTGLRRVVEKGPVLVAGAGASTAALVSRSVRRGLAGLECLVGVPGTIGGAVRMNAGGRLGFVGDRVRWVRGVTRTGEPFRFDRESCGFEYRTSRLAGTFVTEVALELVPTDRDLRAETRALFAAKKASQPLAAATAGCMFKNPGLPGGESAGLLLDRAGMKGVARGGARFSPVHANFVENRGDASARDVMELLVEGRRRVLDRFGVDLALEVELWSEEGERAALVA